MEEKERRKELCTEVLSSPQFLLLLLLLLLLLQPHGR